MSLEALLAVISAIFGGTSIAQFVHIRSQKKKLSAEASQEGAKADALNLENINYAMEVQGKHLRNAEERNGKLSAENDALRHKIREYDYKLEEFDRKIRGMERIISSEIARRSYAEYRICHNIECKDRKPALGTYEPIKEK